jgi:enoyl-CoA hydratase/carnithine racemase
MADRFIELEVVEGIAVLTHHRPEKHDAANEEMDRQLFFTLPVPTGSR